MAKRTRYDLGAPGTQELRDSIVHGAYTTEGTMVAFPLCFPSMTIPIAADESRVTALALARDGVIYGGTSGRCAHVFFAMFHGATGLVFDMGRVEGADHCAAVCCGAESVVACMNGAEEGRVVRRGLQGMPFDLLQEWRFSRPPLDELGPAVPGERIVHAVDDGSGDGALLVTERHLVALAIGAGEFRVLGEVPGIGRIARARDGVVVGIDTDGALWRCRPGDGQIERNAVPLPEGDWHTAPIQWARDPVDSTVYTADAAGRLFAYRDDTDFTSCLGRTPHAPVGPMAVAFDGRLFGACGDGIAKTFSYDPATREVRTLGVAVSVLERRRYGYAFGDAITGRDGQIIFGEDDDLGHLWMYFPRILQRRA